MNILDQYYNKKNNIIIASIPYENNENIYEVVIKFLLGKEGDFRGQNLIDNS